MRNLIAIVAAMLASPALAQGLSVGDQIRMDDLRARQEAAERRSIDQANQMMALEARLQAERSVLDLREQAVAPMASPPGAAARSGPMTTAYPSVPDAILADSNRRVRDAANRPD